MKLLKEEFTKQQAWMVNADTTAIVIQTPDLKTYFQREIPGNHLGKDDSAQIQLVLDMIATEIDQSGAIAKANQELVETQNLLEETRDELKRSTNSSELNRELTVSNSADIDELFDRVIALEEHTGLHEESEEDHEQADETSEEGTSGNTEENDGGDNDGTN